MDNQKSTPDDAATPDANRPDAPASNQTQHTGSPATDPTNPSNQEPVGDWVANERTAERSNNEPGLTDRERKHRKW